jgi:selT/selW/selH-like putative selenoprotein
LKAALEDAFPEADVELIKSSGGAFEIRKDKKLVYSKLETGSFPENGAIIEALKD